MPPFDVTATAHLDSGNPTKPIFFIFLDIEGDPLRACTVNHAVEMPGDVDDEDLAGFTFYPTAQVLSVSDVEFKEGGSDTLYIELSGLLLPDNDLLNAIGDKSKWQGRAARIWVMLRDEARTQQGAIAPYYSGWMSAVRVNPARDKQIIRLEVEGYKALLNSASNRTYLGQSRYDPADLSAAATIGAANGANAGPSRIGPGSPGQGGGDAAPPGGGERYGRQFN